MSKGTIRNLLRRDKRADRVVPPTGFTAQLTLFVSGAMAFLAVFALALSLASGRLADRWASELAGAATLRINAPADQRAAQTEAALNVLQQTPGCRIGPCADNGRAGGPAVALVRARSALGCFAHTAADRDHRR